MTLRARIILGEALHDLRGSFRALILTDLSYKLISLAVLSPMTLLLLRWAMSRAGAEVVTDVEIATFFLTSRQGLLALLLGSAIVTAITAIELACVMAIGFAATHGRRLRVRTALAFGATHALPVLRLSVNMVLRLIVGLLPFVAAIGLTYWVLLREHDINFYLSRRPPEFLAAVGIAAVVVAALVAALLRTVSRWALALPLVLFDVVSPRHALAESAKRTTGHRGAIIVAVLMWAVLSLGLATAAASLPEVMGRVLAPQFSGSFEMLLVCITVLVLLWAVLGLIAGAVNAVLFALILLRAYAGACQPGSAWLSSLPATGDGDVPHLPAAAKVVLATAAILGAAGIGLVAMGTVRQNQPVVVIAHRGASAAAPENTLAAFRLGAELRADFVELDVQESSDGDVVVIHDSDLMKVGGSPIKIWESTAAALRAVDIGSHKGPQFSAERVPTLAEVFAACKGRVKVIVELKTYGHGERLEARVVDLVEAAGVQADTVFMSLDHGQVRTMKQLRPAWRVGALVAKAMGDLTSIDADFLAVEAGLATRTFVRQAHQAGKEVYVWTVNDPVLMVSAISKGVDGLITDKPDVARRVIERRSQMSDEQRILVALLVRLGVNAETLARAATQ